MFNISPSKVRGHDSEISQEDNAADYSKPTFKVEESFTYGLINHPHTISQEDLTVERE